MKELKAKIGQQVKKLRKQAGVSQVRLSEQANLSVESISRLERGVQLPGVETFYRLAKALGVPFSEFFQISLDKKESDLDVLTQRFRALMRDRGTKEGKMALDLMARVFETYPGKTKKQAGTKSARK